MNLVHWDPFGELSNMRNQLNRIFDHTFRRSLAAGPEAAGPRVELYQTDQEVVVTAELPGIQSKDDVEVSVTPDSLNLRGEMKRSQDVNEENYFHSERYYGSFSRTLPLPVEVKPEETRASYQNGLLEIRMPKTEKALRTAHRVQIQ